MALFGPAGLADSFKTMGYKKSIQVADYLSKFGLTAFEYQAGRGVKIGTDAAGNKLLVCKLTVSSTCRVKYAGSDICNVCNYGCHFEVIHKLCSSLSAALDTEGNYTACAVRHIFFSSLTVGVRF